MKNLDRYTPEICSKLRRLAENREWRSWRDADSLEEIKRDIELTYHLHIAADASGKRAGMPPMPPFPISVSPQNILDPTAFLDEYPAPSDTTNN